jgi:hypothetical protein
MLRSAFFTVQDQVTRLIYGVERTTAKMSFYELGDKNMSGDEVKLSDYAGNVLLLVNVASK